MMRKTTALLVLVILWVCSVSCGRHKLGPGEIERNRLFSEIVKRSDRRMVGDDGVLERLLLSAPYPEVGQWCAIALGRIGDPRALPWLYGALHQDRAALRAAALFAIGEIQDREALRRQGRSRAPDVLERVRAMLDDSAPGVRMRAMETLGKIGESADAEAVGRAMRSTVQDGSREARQTLSLGITALMRLRNPGQYPLLRSLAASPDSEHRWRALSALVRLGDPGACPVFRLALASSAPDTRAYAARGLGVCAPFDAEKLASLLNDPSQPLSVRVSAVRALGDLRSAAAVPAIARALQQQPIDTAHPEQVSFAAEAAAALGQTGCPDAVPSLSRMLDADLPSRGAALVSLAKLLRSDPDRFFTVTGDNRFASAAATRAWAHALGELGGSRALQELRTMLAHSLERGAPPAQTLAVPAVIESLARARAPDLLDVTTALMRSRDGAVARAALAAYSPPAGARTPWQPVVESYDAIAAGNDAETKSALLDRLEPWLHEPRVIGTLEEALRDPSRNARVSAARLLRLAARPGVPEDPGPAETSATQISYDLAASARQDHTVARIETSRGTIEIELFREDAPLTVANFAQLARGGFYDGLAFMRVVPFFVIQGGDPRNDQEGGPGYSIRCEINMRPFERGSVGMALAGKDTGGSQFFIALAPQPHLDGNYTCFGRVIAGMSVVDRIIAGDTIKSIQIEEDVAMIDFRRF